MTIQTLTLGKRKFVLVSERDFHRLQRRADKISAGEKGDAAEPRRRVRNRAASLSAAEDRADARVLLRRLDDLRRSGEKPIPYARVRKELGLA